MDDSAFVSSLVRGIADPSTSSDAPIGAIDRAVVAGAFTERLEALAEYVTLSGRQAHRKRSSVCRPVGSSTREVYPGFGIEQMEVIHIEVHRHLLHRSRARRWVEPADKDVIACA